MFEKGKKEKIDTRGISDHGFISSIYFRDPNGYVIELATINNPYKATSYRNARKNLQNWNDKNYE